MGYDRRFTVFHFDSKPNGYLFDSENRNGKLSPRSYPNQCERKWKYSFLSVRVLLNPNVLLQTYHEINNPLAADQILPRTRGENP